MPACIGTPIGSNVTEFVIAQVGCSGKSIIDFTTTSPVGLRKTAIQNPSTGIYIFTFQYASDLISRHILSGIYQIMLSWIPTASQYGPQGFCAAAVDNTDVQSEQWCITFLVGFESPDIIRPRVVQGSASPIGTIWQNHTLFSIQSKCIRIDSDSSHLAIVSH